MRLTAIRLHGFKSFADATVFPVDAAVTGIIGPNGCGKSNIIDAVRWVLGESAAKQLRGASLTDVIFAGSSGRKPAAMASVELHFDNADASAGGAFASYAEIIVRRSVESDGTSHYFINRQRCRRRDIVELLQGTGVGARSYAVIEQGMVSRIVESRPEELRTFVEEAAGVALYRSRRRDSERRMEQVRELLDRHEDRLQQLAKTRERLEKEAMTAARYRELHSELAGHEYRLQSWLLHSARSEHDAANQQYERDEAVLATLMLDVQRLQADTEKARCAMREAELVHAPLQARCETAQAAVQRETVRKAGLQSTLDYARRALDSARLRHDKLQHQQSQDDGEAQAHQDALQLLEKTVADMRVQESRAREECQHVQQTVQQVRLELDRASALRDRHREQITAHETRLHSLRRQQLTLEERLAAEILPEAAEETDEEALALAAETHALMLDGLDEQAEILCEDMQHAEEAYREMQRHEQQLARELAALSSKVETLEHWHGTPAADTPPEWQELPRLADCLQVVPAWQEAIERYFGAGLEALCVPLLPETAARHQQAFVCHGAVPPAWQGIVKSRQGLTAWLAGLQPLPVQDSDLQLSELVQGERYLTLSGSVVSRDGFVPASGNSAGTLARLAHLHDLREELAAAQARQGDVRQHLEQSAARLAATRDALQALNMQREQVRREQLASQNALLLARQQAAHQAQLQERHVRSLQTLEADLVANRSEQEAQEEALRDLQASAPQDTVALQGRWQECEQARRKVEEHWQRLQGELSRGEQEILRHQSWLDARQGNERRMAEARAEALAQMAQEAQVLEETQLALEESALALETLALEAAAHEEARQTAFAACNSAREIMEQVQNRYRDQIQAQAVAEERRNHLHSRLEVLEGKIGELENVFVTADRKPLRFAADEQVDSRQLQENIRRLRGDIERLGAVNMAAVEAFAEADQEFQALFAQCEDLRESLSLLEQAIAELDAQTRERLHATFDTVNRHFGEYFPLLFRGGEGKLSWTDGDILNAGITIHVRPPGKNVKQLSVLSGGEKALTAVALVFSFFRLNPAPFCLLDEVDAPLDDANVARLNALLREMARDTQFVMITHHKRSMQSCDHLIGVTMSEPGVSRLVSVKFEDDKFSQ